LAARDVQTLDEREGRVDQPSPKDGTRGHNGEHGYAPHASEISVAPMSFPAWCVVALVALLQVSWLLGLAYAAWRLLL